MLTTGVSRDGHFACEVPIDVRPPFHPQPGSLAPEIKRPRMRTASPTASRHRLDHQFTPSATPLSGVADARRLAPAHELSPRFVGRHGLPGLELPNAPRVCAQCWPDPSRCTCVCGCRQTWRDPNSRLPAIWSAHNASDRRSNLDTSRHPGPASTRDTPYRPAGKAPAARLASPCGPVGWGGLARKAPSPPLWRFRRFGGSPCLGPGAGITPQRLVSQAPAVARSAHHSPDLRFTSSSVRPSGYFHSSHPLAFRASTTAAA